MSSDISPELLDYFAKRQVADRARAVEIIGRFTKREQQLIHEAAVMGFVRGRLGGSNQDVPHDIDIVIDVLLAIDSNRDLYPLIGDHKCDCCGRNVKTPFHHVAHDDSGDEWDYCQQCYDTGCDLVTCSLRP